jgi:superfamily II DNA or RNA helicase
MKLYTYQQKAVTEAIDNLFERYNALIVAATGAGKTIMMAEAIRRFTIGFKAQFGHYPHTLCLVHRTEIHGQNKDKFEKICPSIPTSEISAERKSTHGYVHFGMVQTVANIIEKLPAFDLIVIDETHHAVADTYIKIIDSNKRKKFDMYLLGVTATPNRGDELPLIELFDNFQQITSKFLIDSHYLVRPKFIDCSPKFGEEVGHLAKNLKDIEDGLDTMIDRYLQVKEGGKSVIFAPNHEFGTVIKKLLDEHGRHPAYLHSGIDTISRENEIKRFETGDAYEIINVDILTEGYDFPNIRNIVDFDTNGSESQWLQKVGRGLRTYPGKKQCTVIDFGGNVLTYPDCEVEVDLVGKLKKPKGEHLTVKDFFKTAGQSEKDYKDPEFYADKEFKPYNPPDKFETLNDDRFGIVYVCCAPLMDCILVKSGNDEYTLYATDKKVIVGIEKGNFNDMVRSAIIGIKDNDKYFFDRVQEGEISNMQVRRLGMKYPLTTLNFYTANCILAWECWKPEIIKGGA